MKCFEGLAFVFLPNLSSSRSRFLADLAQNQGGTIVDDISKLTGSVVVLINDSFVDEHHHLINEDIFLKEFEMNSDTLWNYIVTSNLRCVKASLISRWLKIGKFEISAEDLIGIVSAVCKPSPCWEDSESDTDVGEFNEEDATRHPNVDSAKHAESLKHTDNHGNFEIEEDQNIVENLGKARDKDSVCGGYWSKNQLLISFLSKLANRYKVKGDSYRSRGYTLAKIGIQQYPFEIESGAQAQKEVANVGSSIARKIQIILDTGTLSGVYEAPEFERNLDYLSRCHNVGTYTARRWSNLGLRTFSDVAKRFPRDLQTDWPILFGWSYYQDWSIPIPRKECTEICDIIRKELKLVDARCQVEIQGSYVRGADQSGDVDMLFYKENCDDTAELANIMEEVAIRLYQRGNVKCFLQLTPKIHDLFASEIYERFNKCHLEQTPIIPSGEPVRKFYLGFQHSGCKELNVEGGRELEPGDQFMSLSTPSENPCRRVDFFCCKWSEIGAARLQWTGPKEFNRYLRTVAIQKGLKLTQHGLFGDENVLIESFDENRILELLGEPHSTPLERNYLVKKRRCK
ncbi:related to DNA polymerase IV [Zygosaccharomyces bailii]|nr:related to DNA polymerase IV [Zygosaccharomyces bailii]